MTQRVEHRAIRHKVAVVAVASPSSVAVAADVVGVEVVLERRV